MTVVLVLVTFLVFILLDWALNRKKAVQTVAAPSRWHPRPRCPGVRGGFSGSRSGVLPSRACLGHAGAPKLVRVGVDEFAAALIGRAEKIELPKPGQWIGKGRKTWSFLPAGEKTEMVSPTEGEVVEDQHTKCSTIRPC